MNLITFISINPRLIMLQYFKSWADLQQQKQAFETETLAWFDLLFPYKHRT